MRGVNADEALRARPHAGECTGLSAMPVHDIGLHLRDQILQACPDQGVGEMRLTVNRDPVDAKFQPRRDLRETGSRASLAGQAVGDDADVVARVDLAVGEVEDVTNDSANRCTHRVDYSKRSVADIRYAARTSARRR